MNIVRRIVAVMALLLGAVSLVSAQCETWTGKPNEDEIVNAHVTYRGFVSNKTVADLKTLNKEDFDIAFNNWKKAYEAAPAADGARPFHFIDGRLFYQALMEQSEDATEKAGYLQRIELLYDQEIKCFPKTEAFLLGRKGYDQFYLGGYSIDALNTLEAALEAGGAKTEYIVLIPIGELLKYHYKAGNIEKERVQEVFNAATDMAEKAIEQGGPYQEYYESGLANMSNSISEIESEVFDCAYFKKNLMPRFEENKEDFEVVSYVYNKLTSQGCSESDADVMKVKKRYDEMYAVLAAEQEAERRRLNPAYDANELYKEEKYEESVSRYQDAIDNETDDAKKAQLLYQMASIQSGKLGQTSSALANARRAASLNSGWGKPYILIGDIYARLSRGCGDAWEQRLAILAVIDKYSYAKSIDPEVAGEANRRIANYSGSLPDKEEGFMRKVSAGDKVRVDCIGETVTVRFQ